MTARDGAPVALLSVAHMEPDIFGIPALRSAVTPDAFRSVAGSVWPCSLNNPGSVEQCLAISEAQRLADRHVP